MLRVYATLVDRHDLVLVILAGLIALLACYTAFSLAVRPSNAPRSHTAWLIAAAVVTGCGAWAAHLITVLAYQPGLPAAYDPGLTVLSGLIAVIGSGAGFLVARSPGRMALGGAIIGLALAAMVHVGFAAVSFPAEKHWDMIYVLGSFLIAASLGCASRPRAELMPDIKGRMISTVLLAAAVLFTHFVALAGLSLTPAAGLTVSADTMGPVWFAIAITAVVILIVGLGLIGALIDQHVAGFETAKRDLETALQRADAANASKSMFLANMSHELRTPLNAIIGFSEIMKEEMFGPLGGTRYREYVGDICKCGNHLLSLINDILDMSKFDAGRLELHEEKVDLIEIVTACINAMRPTAEKAYVSLSSKLDSGPILLYADGRRLRQILLNLLSNAIKFTPEGGRVSVAASCGEGGVAITIADTGIGMGPDQIPKALERFGQVDSRLARKHEGTGLGLPLTKCLIELHGGTLRIESEVNVGTTITANFPASRMISRREAA